jgi:prepilin-type N-terminal cleavage/methylation domain-containing protein
MTRNLKQLCSQEGFTMVELLVTTAIFSLLGTAAFIVFIAGNSFWSATDAKIRLQQSFRLSSQKIFPELQESGRDSVGTLQVTILNNTGVNGSDVLRFAVPLCPCGVSAMNDSTDVRNWGAPTIWGQSGCDAPLTIQGNGKVIVCHLPPGNPNNTQTLNVSVNAVTAHMAHGDWLGDCSDCTPTSYTNKQIEYALDSNGWLWRRVLDVNAAVLSEVRIAQHFTDFQASLNAGQNVVSITMSLSRLALQNRTVTMSNTMEVILRNY